MIKRDLAIDVGKIGKAREPAAPSGLSKAEIQERARLEQALEQLDIEHAATLQEIARHRAKLEAEEATENRLHTKRTEKLQARLAKLKQ